MKKPKYAPKFLEALEEMPIVSSACKKVGLSRNVVYEWRKKYPRFKKEMDDALDLGIKGANDVAENQVLKAVQQGTRWAIELWLRNNKKNYMQPKPKNLWSLVNADPKLNGLSDNRIVFVNFSGKKKGGES